MLYFRNRCNRQFVGCLYCFAGFRGDCTLIRRRIFRAAVPAGEGFGYALNLRSTEHESLGSILLLDSPQDDLLLQFGNFSEDDTQFLLKIFYDYVSVPFRVGENISFLYHYAFHLDLEQELEIPFALCNSVLRGGASSANLVIMIMANADAFQQDLQEFFMLQYGIQRQFYIFYGREYMREILLEDPTDLEAFRKNLAVLGWTSSLAPTEFKSFSIMVSEEQFFSFNVRPIPTGLHESDAKENARYFPSAYLLAYPGEDLMFSFLIGDAFNGYITKFVLVGLLDWEQINLNNQPFLPRAFPFSHVYSDTYYDTFKITAPRSPGRYEFLVFAVGVSDEVSRFSLIQHSLRMTIVVE